MPTGVERRTQAERRAASEAALLSAAAELIAERGIERTSLRSIGDRAGASRAMPGYHFGSKEALIERLVLASSSKGQLVVDPFVGSGTTAVVASRLGRKWIAGDGDARYVGLARERLRSA